MKSNKSIARTFGIFFLMAFLSYGLGSGITASITSSSEFPGNVSANKPLFVFGVICMALIHTIVNIGLPVLMQPILKPYNKILSYGYLSAGITATVVLIIGSIFLLLQIPLSSMFTGEAGIDSTQTQTIGALLTKGNFYAYQLGMAIWGLGGLMFSYLLFISKLVPKIFSIWGFTGYLVFIAGTITELFGYPYGVQLAIPGGLFEISLSIWLIIKGFNETKTSNATHSQL